MAKTTPNKSQNENMNNEKQFWIMVLSKQNFNQAIVAVNHRNTLIGKFFLYVFLFLPPVEPV